MYSIKPRIKLLLQPLKPIAEEVQPLCTCGGQAFFSRLQKVAVNAKTNLEFLTAFLKWAINDSGDCTSGRRRADAVASTKKTVG